jgi:hypothetical protein
VKYEPNQLGNRELHKSTRPDSQQVTESTFKEYLNSLHRSIPKGRGRLVLNCDAAHRTAAVTKITASLKIYMYFIRLDFMNTLEPLDQNILGGMNAIAHHFFFVQRGHKESILKIAKPQGMQIVIDDGDRSSESTVEASWCIYDGGPENLEPQLNTDESFDEQNNLHDRSGILLINGHGTKSKCTEYRVSVNALF